MSDAKFGIKEFARIVADDLIVFANLHDRELTQDILLNLKQDDFPDCLGLRLLTDDGQEATELIQHGIDELPEHIGQGVLDELASDFVDIYLVNALQASPCESVWTDEDGLMMQHSMFELRSWYEKHDLAAVDWRMRPDDHLVCQLEFLAHLFRHAVHEEHLKECARFLDEHLLLWINEFSLRVANRCRTPFYAGLAMLTATYVNELRDLLTDTIGMPRPQPEESTADEERELFEKEIAYMPGMAPSW